MIASIAASATGITKGELRERTQLSLWQDVVDYCRTSMKQMRLI
jgi:DNA repair protein RadC